MDLPNFPVARRQSNVGSARVAHFGGYLRLRASVPAGAAAGVIASVALKE
jgi:hypothetical protein